MATAINQTNAIRQSYQPVTVSSCTHYWAALCSRCQGSHDLHLPSGGLVVRVSVGTQNPLPGVRQPPNPIGLERKPSGQ